MLICRVVLNYRTPSIVPNHFLSLRIWWFMRSPECRKTRHCRVSFCVAPITLAWIRMKGQRGRSLSFTITANLRLICSVLIKLSWVRWYRCWGELHVARRPVSTLLWWNLQRPAFHYYSISFHILHIILCISYFGTESDLFITVFFFWWGI